MGVGHLPENDKEIEYDKEADVADLCEIVSAIKYFGNIFFLEKGYFGKILKMTQKCKIEKFPIKSGSLNTKRDSLSLVLTHPSENKAL